MKNLNLLNLKSIVQSKVRWLFALFALLTLGVVEMWAAEGVPKQIPKDTAYIITPTISTLDTIYLKYEDARYTEPNWWSKHSGEMVQLILALLLGSGVAILTTKLNNGYEQQRENRRLAHEEHQLERALRQQRQEYIIAEGVKREHQLFELILDIQNIEVIDTKKQLLEKFGLLLQKSRLDVRTELYRLANNIYTYNERVVNGKQDRDEYREKNDIDRYYEMFNNV